MAVGSAQPFDEKGVKDMVESPRENLKPRGCLQADRKTFLHESYCTRVFRGGELVECAVLREPNLTARKVLRYRALIKKASKLGKQEQSDVAEMAKTYA